MMEAKEVVLVMGGTGKIGTALVHLLASDATRPVVRVGTRDATSSACSLLKSFNSETVIPTELDVASPESLAPAMDGVTKLCIIAPFVEDMAKWHRDLMEAAVAAGSCRYVVKVSVTGARSPDSTPPPGRIPLAHWRGEEAVRAAGIPATMLRPTIFMQHFLTTRGLYERADDRFYLPTGNARVALLDCRDIGAMAARLLCMPPQERRSHEGQAYELTGPTAVTGAEIASILTWIAGRPIQHIDGEDSLVAHCAALGVPDRVKYVFAEAAGGWFARVENEAFLRVMGRLPTSFGKFAYDHATYFRPVRG